MRRPHYVPLWRVLLAAGGITVVGVVGLTASGVIGVLSAVIGVGGLMLGGLLIARSWRTVPFGAANTATLARVVGTAWEAALTAQAVLAELTLTGLLLILGIGTGCLILDGIDGRLARARQETSAFGARFDMETDAALLLVLSVAVVATGVSHGWVLAIGLMRYGYVAASQVLPQLRVPLRLSYSRKVVAVIQGIALLAALALRLVPGLPQFPVTGLLVGSLAVLCWSFGRDIRWQLRTYGRRHALSVDLP